MRQPIRESYCHKNEILRIFTFCPFLLKCRPASCKRFASFFFTNFRPFIRLDFLPSGYDTHFACFSPQLHSFIMYCSFFPKRTFQKYPFRKSYKSLRYRAIFLNNIISKNIEEMIGVGRCLNLGGKQYCRGVYSFLNPGGQQQCEGQNLPTLV